MALFAMNAGLGGGRSARWGRGLVPARWRQSTSSRLAALDSVIEATLEMGEMSRALVATSMTGAQKSNLQRARILDVVGIEERIRTATERSGVNSRKTAACTEKVTKDTDAANETLSHTAQTMVETAATISMSAGLMREFVDRMAEVERLVGTINGIAMRTNLLALNAAIEAAHAGREGDGFSVIAQEIRQLADRTSEQTDDIANKIERMSASAKAAGIAMSKGVLAVEASIGQSAEVQQSFHEIREAMHVMQGMSAEVAEASDRQIEAGKRVGASIMEVDELAGECTQEADASAEISMKLVVCMARFHEGWAALYPTKAGALKVERDATSQFLARLGTHKASVRAALVQLRDCCTGAGTPFLVRTAECDGSTASVLRFGDVAATDTLPWLDAINAKTGCVATVFALDGDRLVRVATTVKRPNGRRATGTALNAKGVAARRLLAGKSHHGAAYVLGKPFLAAYEPVLSAAGELLGAIYVGHAIEADKPVARN